MRVISGTLGGRRFNPPQLDNTRPTTDFAKTGLFNILNNNFDFTEVSFLDLFAGTGSISFEFGSRGSKRIVSIENDLRCLNFIVRMKNEWKLDSLEVIKNDVFRFLDFSNEKFDVIFAGPPYALETIAVLPEKIFQKNILNEGGWFILETNPKYDFKEHHAFFRRVNYGQTNFHFFKK